MGWRDRDASLRLRYIRDAPAKYFTRTRKSEGPEHQFLISHIRPQQPVLRVTEIPSSEGAARAKGPARDHPSMCEYTTEQALNADRHFAPRCLQNIGNTSAALWPRAEQTLLGLIRRPREPLFRLTNLLALQATLLRVYLLLLLPPAQHIACLRSP